MDKNELLRKAIAAAERAEHTAVDRDSARDWAAVAQAFAACGQLACEIEDKTEYTVIDTLSGMQAAMMPRKPLSEQWHDDPSD